MAMGVLLGEPFGRLKNHLVHGLIAGINVSSAHCRAQGEGANGWAKGGATEDGSPSPGFRLSAQRCFWTTHPRSGPGLKAVSRLQRGVLLVVWTFFLILVILSLLMLWFCSYLRTCLFVGEDARSATGGSHFQIGCQIETLLEWIFH